MRSPTYVLLAASLITLISSNTFADWSCKSSSSQAALVELYTSQGCSSCPPADRWLSALKDRDDLWTEVVPVAWHVTYWDYLGWRDPFGRRENDQRQRRMAAAVGSGVYTPGVFLNRGEYQRWRVTPPQRVDTLSMDVGVLSAKSAGAAVAVSFEPAAGLSFESPRAEIVYLRANQKTDVGRGENRGRNLKHDFVAGAPERVELRFEAGRWIGTASKSPEADDVAVALWVLDQRGDYVQATGGWL
ncbi:MAG: DUF1223 domain-containing protein [Pseudomonadota bacterium]